MKQESHSFKFNSLTHRYCCVHKSIKKFKIDKCTYVIIESLIK